MPVHFDAGTSRLRLDRDSFRALTTVASGGAHGDAAVFDELCSAGVIERRGGAHPALRPGMDAVADPICRLVIRIRDGRGSHERGDGWLGQETTALLLDLPDGLCEFGTVHPSFLPAMLARIVQLGPRPRLDTEPAQARPELIDQLTDPDPARRRAAAAELPAAGLPELRRDWAVQASWRPAPGSDGVRALRVLDTPAGLWLVEAGPERSVLFPTTPSAVWRSLVRLLPTDHELPGG